MNLDDLSLEDLRALRAGNLDGVSLEGLRAMRGLPKQTGAEMAAADTGAGSAFLVSAGKRTSDILNGITQKYLEHSGDEKALSGLATNVADERATFKPLADRRPIATTLGAALPSMAIPGSTLPMAVLSGAVPELLSYGTDQERLSRGALGGVGGAAGYGLGAAVNRVLKPAGVGVNPNELAMQAAGRVGFKPLAGQATQNPAFLNVENYLARNPGSSGRMMALNRANQESVNRAAASSIGQKSSSLGPDVLAAGEKAIGSEFERLQAITAPSLGDDFVNALVKIEAENASKGSFRNAKIDSVVEKALDLAAANDLTGKAYKEIRSELSAQASRAFTSKGGAPLGQALKTIRSALDTAAEVSLSKADQEAWKLSREQWGNWKVLTKGLVAESGDVSPARVAMALRQQGPGFRTGAVDGPLVDVGRIGEGIKGALNPNSGNQVSMMLYGNPFTGIPLAASNWAAGHVYTNPIIQKYLRDGIADVGKNGEIVIRATGAAVTPAMLKEFSGAH